MAKFKLELGRLHWKAIRNYVEELNFSYGYSIKMTEGGGRISRPFYFEGPQDQLNNLLSILKKHEEYNG